MRNSYYRLIKVDFSKRSNSKAREVEIARTNTNTGYDLRNLVEIAVNSFKSLSRTEELFIEIYSNGEFFGCHDQKEIKKLAKLACIEEKKEVKEETKVEEKKEVKYEFNTTFNAQSAVDALTDGVSVEFEIGNNAFSIRKEEGIRLATYKWDASASEWVQIGVRFYGYDLEDAIIDCFCMAIKATLWR